MKRRSAAVDDGAAASHLPSQHDGTRRAVRKRRAGHAAIAAAGAAAVLSLLPAATILAPHHTVPAMRPVVRSYAKCVRLPMNRTRRTVAVPVPDNSEKTYYSSSVVFRSSLNTIGKMLDLQPGYRRVDAAREASVVWTKKMADGDPMLRLALGKGALSYKDIQPWQRINHLRNEKTMDDKGIFVARMREHECPTGTRAWFLPETYRLHVPKERDDFLRRLEGGGIDEPWVWKDPTVDRGEGIAMLGAGSDQLKELQLKIRNPEAAASPLSWNNKTVPWKEAILNHSETPKESDFDGDGNAKNKMLVQKYVPTLLWDGHKFDLRVYWLVASVDPLLVYYHDGIVRVSLTKYAPDDFSSKSHLTNVAQSLSDEKEKDKDLATRSFDDLDQLLRRHAEALPLLAAHIREDPLANIRTQMKEALAFVADAFREEVFAPQDLPADNSYALFGADFLIDNDLNIWVTELQYGPNESVEAKAKRDVIDRLVPQMFDMVAEVREKQTEASSANATILPLKKAKTWELVYG